MVGVLALPPELILSIIQLVGWNSTHYSDKERQQDLGSFCLVHPGFLGPARSVLYGSPSIRNAGRAYLLDRTLSSSSGAQLAPLVQSIWHPANTQQDSGHPRSITSILERTSPSSLTLGSVLFTHGPASDRLRQAVMSLRNVRRFSYGFGAWSGERSPALHDILSSCEKLEHLALDKVSFAQTFPSSDSLQPPSYSLASLALSDVHIGSKGDLSWILGATGSSLRHLSLKRVVFDIEDDPTASVLLGETQLRNLESLVLKDVRWLGDGVTRTMYPCHVDAFLPLCANLRDLSVGDVAIADDYLVLDRVHFPPSLVFIELYGRMLFHKIRLQDAIQDGALPRLRKVELVGPPRSALEVRQLAALCDERGIGFHVRFMR